MQNSNIWQAVLGEIELGVSRGSFVTWFKNTQLLRADSSLVIIGVPNIFIKQQLERKYADTIKEILAKNGVTATRIEFKISSGPVANNTRIDDEPVSYQPAEKKAAGARQSGLTHAYRQGLNEKYTFDTFIVGSGNELAYAACQAIAQNPGTKYNPLFIYGGVGIGKTHLVQAVGNEIVKLNPSAHVVYVSSEQFVQEFLDAIRYKKNTDFAGYYRSADVLIVDDIQFIAGKEKTQEEFFHTFNALHQANKQIIISGDKPPSDIPTLEERLRSRFAWGMSIDMQIPDFETRCAIVQTKASQHNTELEQPVVEFLANYVTTNIRELEGVLNQLLAYCEMRNLLPDIAVTSTLFSNDKKRPKHLSARQVVDKTAKHFQILLEDLIGPKRDKDIVVPRQVAMYILRSELHLSFPKIAHELGRKDHTTAIHSVEKIEKEMNEDPRMRQHIIEIKEKLYA
ncbi:chromosomal replication initiator protein DnaA [bacterium]|nr:chromosomal replication initiator protein DnaA [bacterium]NBX98466.1 chromosomal replication initiator protein DnaA [bacterium]NDC94339.1 chromosomal replication initiator protein DnaA [bacterium]NDD84446.1 chromosomal replication initiator protein DnaA [bacterium]NDG30320.1 chromosomal replication initiator protein DnaA [bacterium]